MVIANTIRESIRHVLYRLHLSRLLYLYRVFKGGDSCYLRHESLSERFSEIYRDEHWVIGCDDSRSGSGSTLGATANLHRKLPELFDKLDVRSVVDVGCGDFNWMKEVQPLPSYIGIDIVESVIAANRAQYSREGVVFICADVTTIGIPNGDAVLCREVLFHLSFEDIARVMRRVAQSGAKYFIATTDEGTLFNADITSGDFRMLNLRRAPTRLPAPIVEIADDVVTPLRRLAAWKVSDLPKL